MGDEIEFERCINFMVRMIEKYGDDLLHELEQEPGKSGAVKEIDKKQNTATDRGA